MMYPHQPPRHKVFVSFHHDDQKYKDLFVRMMRDDMVDESVGDGDIDDRLPTDRMRQIIRDKFIRDASVTVVLIGPCTWQRKHVDWEIGSSLRDTELNSRCGLVGILLPNHPDFQKQRYNPYLIPPRLADNCKGSNSFACIYGWPGAQEIIDLASRNPDRVRMSAIDLAFLSEEIRRFKDTIRSRIHRAFRRRNGTPPDNSRDQFARNRSGRCSAGWWD